MLHRGHCPRIAAPQKGSAQIDAWHHGWQETGQRGHIFGAVGQKGLPLRVCERAAADR